MVITGKDSKIFWGKESSWKAGLTGVHYPFNPMETIKVVKPTYSQKQIRTGESLDFSITWSEFLNVGEGEINTIYKDPFILTTAFTHKTSTGFGPGLTGVITADFSDDDDKDYLWIHYHKHDQEEIQNIDRTLKGIQITSYGWTCEKGDLVREKFGVKVPNIETGVVAFTTDSDFDDGNWSNWNEHSDVGYHSTQVLISFCGSGLSDLGFKWENFDLSCALEKSQEHTGESKIASLQWEGNKEYTLSVTGRFAGANKRKLIEEAESDYINKAKGIVRVSLTDDDGNVSYLQFTNGFVDGIDNYDIPAAAESWQGTVTFKANKPVISFNGLFTEETDPSSRITT